MIPTGEPSSNNPGQYSEEHARSASPEVVPAAVSRMRGWEGVLAPTIEERHGIVSTSWTDSPISPHSQKELEQRTEIVEGNAIQVPGGDTNEDGTSAPRKEVVFVESASCEMDDCRDFVMNLKEWFNYYNNRDNIDCGSNASSISTQTTLDRCYCE